ncbi:MAG: DUF1700 domain-containing protein [Clostridiales bacterium]|nr:DUF1700 domain-containing protein [Clostridiales bacterium]
MNRQDFLSRLEVLLQGLPAEEKREALEYYENYFEDAGEGQEAQVIRELESPEKVASNIREGMGYDTDTSQSVVRPSTQVYGVPPTSVSEKKSHAGNTIWMIVVIILTSPFWVTAACCIFGLVIGVAGCLIGVLCGLAGCIVGTILGGFIGIAHGIGLLVIGKTAVGLVGIGCSLLLLACGCLFLPLLVLICGKGIPWIVTGIVKGFKRLFKGKKGEKE